MNSANFSENPFFQDNPDGNLLSDGYFAYTWDDDNRLVTAMPIAPTNGSKRVRNAYDWRSRRAEKSVDAWDATTESWIPSETRRYVYDDWNPILETVVTQDSTNRIAYLWGPDLSDTLQGAGGVGGLLAVSIDGAYCFPCYDANGNVTAYVAEDGTLAASYTYDAFGNLLSATGPLADTFTHRFSTKPYDSETGLYYYGYRYYSPTLGRFLNRDPIEESGGANLYAFCANDPVSKFDVLGLIRLIDQSWRNLPDWKLDELKSEIEARFEGLVSKIREPFQSAIRENWPHMVFYLKGNDSEDCFKWYNKKKFEYSEYRGKTKEEGQTLRDVLVVSRNPKFEIKPEWHRKKWTNTATLCICQIHSLDDLAEVAVHETAHNVGWGGYYSEPGNPDLDNLPGHYSQHPNPGYWRIPGRSNDD